MAAHDGGPAQRRRLFLGCPQCGADNRAGSRFCKRCGVALVRACATCGTPLDAGARFCDQCGAPADSAIASSDVRRPDGGGRQPPTAQRRLVSILFADLAGFTQASEKRDAEDVRELLTRYFDGCRAVIGRYGGTVEKFIGDAVMAVWGTPVTQEDDAERAVRAALDLVEMVATLGADVDIDTLRVRAGVLTGEAAVTLGDSAQGMVAGDMVNTASRIQTAAEPGTVLVGDSTRRATEAAVEYEDAGDRALKGKADAVKVWRAVRVVGTRRGALRSAGFEAPFSGRDRQLRLVKDLFHAAADERAAHLVSVVGVAGIGKSRLAWEFCKYIDGLASEVFWHQGRCLAYGEGVTYSALADIVRMRTGITEGEPLASAMAKLRATLAENVPDPEEQRWVEPRLAHLLGLEDRAATDRDDLFGAWRLFFERLAEQSPTVLVIEDLQWADASLLEFIEHLLDWSRNHALYVITLARPELSERHPTWGGTRSFTSLLLDPLSDEVMRVLLSGLVPGMPEELRGRIVDRAAGVPLYAVETVRSLVDRGLLVPEGAGFRVTGSVDTLEVPETLHALIAARLDGLPEPERRLLQDASVLGKTFSSEAAAAVGDIDPAGARSLLTDLVRREVLTLQSDPRSPERGLYAFGQDLIRWVAYETLSRQDRKRRHLAAGEWLEDAWGKTDGDVVEVVASHFLEAYRLAPADPDAARIRTKAAEMMTQAAEHAASLAANPEAQHYFEEALHLVEGAQRQAEIHERAAEMALLGGRIDEAAEHFEQAITLFGAAGLAHPAARASARSAEITRMRGDVDTAIARMEDAFAILSADPGDADLAALAAQLGRFHFFVGNMDLASARTRVALDIAEHIALPGVISNALNTLGVVAAARGNREEGVAMLTHALQVALDHDVPSAALRSYCNVADSLSRVDRDLDAIAELRSALLLARKIGDRVNEGYVLSELLGALYRTGQWHEVTDHLGSMSHAELTSGEFLSVAEAATHLHIHRGQIDAAVQLLADCDAWGTSSDMQTLSTHAALVIAVDTATGRYTTALEAVRRLLEDASIVLTDEAVKKAFVDGMEAGVRSGRIEEVERTLDGVDERHAPQRPPFVTAHAARFRGRLAVLRGDAGAAEAAYLRAAQIFEEITSPLWLAVTRLELAEALSGEGRRREAQPLLDQARSVFEELEAAPWMDRCDRVAVLSTAS
ncbi:MAG TPA: adenylate/guanylate cyclase domain-containing protein [Candidatus Dormibacteraeota bacterium]|nr:adenylate/guanylate cyclase domain-containing protein [Candidatus Dormibacteraeota bacterium]